MCKHQKKKAWNAGSIFPMWVVSHWRVGIRVLQDSWLGRETPMPGERWKWRLECTHLSSEETRIDCHATTKNVKSHEREHPNPWELHSGCWQIELFEIADETPFRTAVTVAVEFLSSKTVAIASLEQIEALRAELCKQWWKFNRRPVNRSLEWTEPEEAPVDRQLPSRMIRKIVTKGSDCCSTHKSSPDVANAKAYIEFSEESFHCQQRMTHWTANRPAHR
jgi:hypothetical protein